LVWTLGPTNKIRQLSIAHRDRKMGVVPQTAHAFSGINICEFIKHDPVKVTAAAFLVVAGDGHRMPRTLPAAA
jgi:hypothetical protein